MPIADAHFTKTRLILELVIVAVLTLVNGVLAMSEMAIVSSRATRLRVLIEQGNKGAAMALRLSEDPGKFLSSVQIGITLVGVLSGAFSGATLGLRLTEWFLALGVPDNLADGLGFGLVVVIITYLSLIIGELVPKQIALRDPERIAARIAPIMNVIAIIAAPLVWLLDISGQAILALLGQRGESEETVTEEEVKTLIAEATHAGVLESEERNMISGVMRLADRSARGLMTPRRDVEVIDLADSSEDILRVIRASNRSRLPVQDGDADSIVGVLSTTDLIDVFAEGRPLEIRKLVKPAPVVMDRTDALDVVRAIKASVVHLALVFDEYGHFEGIVTSADVLEAITGAFSEEEGSEPPFVIRDDGSFLVEGWMQVDEFKDQIGVPVPRDAKYETVAGYVLAEINHLPVAGETFERGHWRFEIIDMDGRRIDKVLVTRLE